LHPGYGVVTWIRVAFSLTWDMSAINYFLENLVQSRKYPSAVKQAAKTAGIKKYGFVVLLYTKSSFHPTCIESGATGAITTGCRSGGVISMRGPANG